MEHGEGMKTENPNVSLLPSVWSYKDILKLQGTTLYFQRLHICIELSFNDAHLAPEISIISLQVFPWIRKETAN